MVKNKSNPNKIHRIIITILLVIAGCYLLLNNTARKIISRHIEYSKLSSGYERALKENQDYKKRLEYLEGKEGNSKYIERAVKLERNLIADGEIEYHFNDNKTQENKNEI